MSKAAIERVEEDGVVFIDEIDKIASFKDSSSRKSPSTDGVQRDLLPLIEGTNVMTSSGKVNTQHILFVCAGAFNISKPDDILPELQGRLPVIVKLDMLTRKEFELILLKVKYNLIEQYTKLLGTDGINIKFSHESIKRIAEITGNVNFSKENFGARRLFGLIENLLEDLSYGDEKIEEEVFVIGPEYVDRKLKEWRKESDFEKYLI